MIVLKNNPTKGRFFQPLAGFRIVFEAYLKEEAG
jgi:hypothetical protein